MLPGNILPCSSPEFVEVTGLRHPARPYSRGANQHAACDMKQFWVQFFTWWNGQTLGTRFYTWRRGQFVGTDDFGNKYYRATGPLIDPSVGQERRWVVYNGEADASRVPPGWRAWLSHNEDVAPSEDDYQPREWEQVHIANLTGTAGAYRPKGSQLSDSSSSYPLPDYAPWTPPQS